MINRAIADLERPGQVATVQHKATKVRLQGLVSEIREYTALVRVSSTRIFTFDLLSGRCESHPDWTLFRVNP